MLLDDLLALLALSAAIEARDPYTRGHSTRVARMAHDVGVRLGCDQTRLALLQLGGALHDVRKLVISPTVLNKPGPPTTRNSQRCANTPRRARGWSLSTVLCDLPAAASSSTTSAGTAGAIRRGGRASEIPLEARILSVVDCLRRDDL